MTGREERLRTSSGAPNLTASKAAFDSSKIGLVVAKKAGPQEAIPVNSLESANVFNLWALGGKGVYPGLSGCELNIVTCPLI